MKTLKCVLVEVSCLEEEGEEEEEEGDEEEEEV